MKIKSESELAIILSYALSAHANKVQNGAIDPYRKFLTGAESVDVRVFLKDDGQITVQQIQPDSDPASLPRFSPTETDIKKSDFEIPSHKPRRKPIE